jgi:hypothetical protein
LELQLSKTVSIQVKQSLVEQEAEAFLADKVVKGKQDSQAELLVHKRPQHSGKLGLVRQEERDYLVVAKVSSPIRQQRQLQMQLEEVDFLEVNLLKNQVSHFLQIHRLNYANNLLLQI